MKLINFIGTWDKTDFMLFVAKMLTSMAKKVLYVDSCSTQKCKYIVPAIEIKDQYVTSFEEIDIAVGFKSQKEIVEYLKEEGRDFNEYEFALIDTDTPEMARNFDTVNANSTFIISPYDKYHIFKTVNIINEMLSDKFEYVDKIVMNKIYMYSYINTSDESYIDFTYKDLGIILQDKKLYLPLEEGDRTVGIQNQYAGKILLKHLSKQYKKSLVEAMSIILEDDNKNNILKVLKVLEREG